VNMSAAGPSQGARPPGGERRAATFGGDPTSYRTPAWLRGGHAQTIWPAFMRQSDVATRRERVEIGDGDFWDFDWLATPAEPNAPLVVLFHGLEGSAASPYARALFAHLAAMRWRGVVPHFRGCGGEPNRLPRAYHSGDHAEVAAILTAIRARVDANTVVFAAGVSLGGSALLNWLGRQGHNGNSILRAAAAVSAPLDLSAAGYAIGRGANRLYTHVFLTTLKPKALAMAARFPGLIDAKRVRGVRTMWEFDDAVTAPLHGFAGADDYWTRASSKRWLAEIALPTLVLNAKNDPFIPAASLAHPGEVGAAVTLEQPQGGGHAGFVVGRAPGRLDWLPRRLTNFFVDGV
jgi:uncharacterized protein